MPSGEQIISKIDLGVLGILQKYLDSWNQKQVLPQFRNNENFQNITDFILYWNKNKGITRKLATFPGSAGGNMAYIIKVLDYHSHLV